MRASASRSGPSRWWQKLPPRGSTMAISPRCCTRRAIAARSLSRGRIPPRLRGGWPSQRVRAEPAIGPARGRTRWAGPTTSSARSGGVLLGVAVQPRRPARKSASLPKTGRDKASLQTQRHEAKFAIRIGDKQKRRLTAFALELVNPLLQRVGVGDRLLRYLDHHVARIEPLVGGGGLGFYAGDHDALYAVLDLVALAQVIGHIGE